MRWQLSNSIDQMPIQISPERSIPVTPAAAIPVSEHYLSAIANCICPECGGPMGGRSNVFECQGQCGRDWRSTWQSAFVAKRSKPHSATRRIAA